MINQYEGKTGAVWRIETDAAAKSETVAMADVLPLKLENGMVMGVVVNGNLMNKLPKGLAPVANGTYLNRTDQCDSRNR